MLSKYNLIIFELENIIINMDYIIYNYINTYFKTEFIFNNNIKYNIKKYLNDNQINNLIELIDNNEIILQYIDGFELIINKILNNNTKIIIISNIFKNLKFLQKKNDIFNKISFFYYIHNIFDKKIYTDIFEKYNSYNILCFINNINIINNLINNNIKIIMINSSKLIQNIILYFNNFKDFDKYLFELKIINTLRLLSIDMINNSNSGHPGSSLGCAPIIYTLWCNFIKYNNNIDRDRFILSNGHCCSLLYSILYLFGYYSLNDLKNFRKIDSITPGHPEYNPKLGIEVSTGNLGQGIANGVGMAIASKKLKLNNKIYVICGDGCLMEGISYEACSLAGHLQLNNLILLYDCNKITIDGSIDITFTENIKLRFESQKWNVLEVLNGDIDINNINDKIKLSLISEYPTIIIINTTIGYGSDLSNDNKSHGTPFNKIITDNLKENFNFNKELKFYVDNDVKLFFDKHNNNINNIKNYNNDNNFSNYNFIFYQLNKLKNNHNNNSTRELSKYCLDILYNNIDNIIIGSADLAESTKVITKYNKDNFITKDNFDSKYIHFGVREHAMVAISIGLSTYQILPIISTFLIFTNYCLSSIRLSALSMHKIIYILTHDSLWIGEDGPSHQCCESLTILRSIPNLITLRPCNVDEVVESYKIALNNLGPTCIVLSRQEIKYIRSYDVGNIQKGAYIIYEYNTLKRKSSNISIILISSGSEVELAIDVAKDILDYNIKVISFLSTNIFDKQSDKYKNYIFPNNTIKISIEAGATIGWYKYANHTYGIDSFGKSGNIDDLKKYFKFDKENIKKYIYNIINQY